VHLESYVMAADANNVVAEVRSRGQFISTNEMSATLGVLLTTGARTKRSR